MNRDIIVIGASAGGIGPLKKLVAGFPADFPAAVFVTQHLASRTDTVLPEILNANGPLPASHPAEGEPIRPGHIYIAPPDRHLLLAADRVHLGQGPRENMQRPCINVMFRSAATTFGPRIAGVVLSGLLDDGAAGLWEIRQQGGLTVVQEPSEAAYRSMPESAIRGLDVDYILPVTEISSLLVKQTQMPDKRSEQTMRGQENLELSTQACPSCGGVMQRATFGRLHEYRCHTGHRFGTMTMLEEKTSTLERSLYAALAQAEELVFLLEEENIVTGIDARRKEAQALRELIQRQTDRITPERTYSQPPNPLSPPHP